MYSWPTAARFPSIRHKRRTAGQLALRSRIGGPEHDRLLADHPLEVGRDAGGDDLPMVDRSDMAGVRLAHGEAPMLFEIPIAGRGKAG
jgi:hypothetical protein